MEKAQTCEKRTSMPYVRLGESGLKVSKLILGCMSYGAKEWFDWVLPEEEGIKQIKAAYDAGIQTFDTADMYSNGTSEEILGKAIKQHNLPREEIVVITKVFVPVGHTPRESYYQGDVDPDEYGYVNQYGLSRKHIFDGVKNALKRLQLDYIDVLLCHRFDPSTPVAETMNALHDVVKAGHVRYVGMSSCLAWQFNVMQNYAISHDLTPFICMQNHYNLVYREEEREMMPTLKHFGVGCTPWSPIARGVLARPLSSQSKRGESDVFQNKYLETEGNKEIVRRVEEVAKRTGHSMAQISLAWIMAKDPVAAPVIGTTSMQNLKDLIDSVRITLSEEDIKYLEEPYEPMHILA